MDTYTRGERPARAETLSTPGAARYRLSVFFPAYNDAQALPALIANTFEVLSDYGEDYEVLVIDDGSTDDTAEVLERLRDKHPDHLRVVTHSENRGYGGALRTGFAEARHELVFYTDGDGQYDLGELPRLLTAMTPEVGLVNGYKLERQDPWHRIAIGHVYNRFARFLFRIRIRDIDCDFRLIRRSVLEKLDLTSTSGTICVELVRKIELSECEVVEVGVHHYPRRHGRSQFFRVRSLLTTLLQLLLLYSRLVVAPALRKR
jgi:glycosyltransferase involved in cell wall biosynthesis